MKVSDDALLIGLALFGVWALMQRAPAIALGTRAEARGEGATDVPQLTLVRGDEGCCCAK